MPHRFGNRKTGDGVSSRRAINPRTSDRLKETTTAILAVVFLWLFVFQVVYRVILNFAEAYLFLLKSCHQILLRLVADCKLLLDSVRQIFWYILDVRLHVFRLLMYCIHMVHADVRLLDVLVACSSPLRQGILICVLVLDWCCECYWRTARRGTYFLLHCVDTVYIIVFLVTQVLRQFIFASVRAVKATQIVFVYTIMSYVCMAQVALMLLMDCVRVTRYVLLCVGHSLDRLARWLWHDVERGVESVILEFLATTWQILRTSVILGVYSVIICVRLVQVIGSWSLALCWGAPWTFQRTSRTKKAYSAQSKPFQTTREYLVDLVLSLSH